MDSTHPQTATLPSQRGAIQNPSGDPYLRAALLALLAPLLLHASTILDYTPESLWTYDLARWMNVPALAVAMIAAIVGTRRLEITIPMGILVALSISMTGTSLALHFHIGGAAEWTLLLTLITAGWLLANLARDSDPTEITSQLALLLLVISTLMVVRGLAAWLPHCLYDGTCNEFYGNYIAIGNRRGFNHIQTAIIPFLFWLTITRPPGYVRTIALCNTTAMLWMVATTGARGTAVALLATGIIMAWRFRLTASQWRTVALTVSLAASAVITTTAIQYLYKPTDTHSARIFTIDVHSSGRIDLWREVLAGTLNAPLLGQGPGAVATLAIKPAHAHNLFFEAAHDYGLSAAVFTVVFVLLSAVLAVFRLPQQAQPVAWATCALLAHSLVSGIYFYPFGQVLLLLMLALTWGWSHSLTPISMRAVVFMRPGTRIIVGSMVFALVVSMLMTLAGTFPDYGSGIDFAPRLWLGGRYSLPISE